MKQIVILSGKGGTGKTVITGAFAALAKNPVLADCDVDAADLHLLLHPVIEKQEVFESGKVALINKNRCIKCGKCIDLCRFEAINHSFDIDPIACEGCAFCHFICPENAITIENQICGQLFISNTRFGPLIHAKLGVAAENSGKLVSLVRENAKKMADKTNADWIIIDGSPGIGCPVIASLGGADCVIIVTEPTLSGLHDAKRVIQVAKHFRIPVKLIINKFDLNEDISLQIKNFCQKNKIDLVGKIKFSKDVIKAVIEGKTIIEQDNISIKKDIVSIWENIKNSLNA